MILRVRVPYPPVGLLVRDPVHQLVQRPLGFGTVHHLGRVKFARLPLHGSDPGHGQRERNPLAYRLVTLSQVDQILLQNLELLVAGHVQGDRHRPRPVVGRLDDRVQLLDGALRGQAHAVSTRQFNETRPDEDMVEGAEQPTGVPSAEIYVQFQLGRVNWQRLVILRDAVRLLLLLLLLRLFD